MVLKLWIEALILVFVNLNSLSPSFLVHVYIIPYNLPNNPAIISSKYAPL